MPFVKKGKRPHPSLREAIRLIDCKSLASLWHGIGKPGTLFPMEPGLGFPLPSLLDGRNSKIPEILLILSIDTEEGSTRPLPF